MNLSQTIFILLTINLLMVPIGFVIEHRDIDKFEENMVGEFSEILNNMEEYAPFTMDTDIILVEWTKGLVNGAFTALNLVRLAVIIFSIIMFNYLKPMIYLAIIDQSSILILKYIGYFAICYLFWFNIKTIIQIYTLYKGSSR